MEYAQIKEWLDKQVNNIEERKELKDFNNQICAAAPDETVLISKGINIIADIIGEPLKEKEMDIDGVCYMYSFIYRGI